SDFPIASVAAVFGLDESKKTVKEARIVLGSVGVTPVIAKEASQQLIGKKLSDNLGEEAGILASKAAQPTTDVLGTEEYKRKLVGLLTRDMVNLAIKRASRET
ncbi:xanthine dehydrogenase family protein subunit M, partial [Chloroflexota bacterium]